MPHMTMPRRQVLDLLEANGGTIMDASGRVSAMINQMLPGPERSAVGINAILRSMETQGLIRREIRSKRTYSISLATMPTHVEEPELEPARPIEVVQQAPDLHALADALLLKVVDVINADPSLHEEEIADLKNEMAAAYEEAGIQRTRAAEAEEESKRLRRERDILRSQAITMEQNIDAMLKGERNGDGGRAYRTIKRFMEERPMTRAS